MAVRKSLLHTAPERPELKRLLEAALRLEISDAQLNEQRVSFAFGNAPAAAVGITKDSVRATSARNRLILPH